MLPPSHAAVSAIGRDIEKERERERDQTYIFNKYMYLDIRLKMNEK